MGGEHEALPVAVFRDLVIASSLLASMVAAPTPANADSCRYVLGFKAIRDAIPDIVGDCVDNEAYDDSGAVQHTKRGLMAWRAADNFTAFTDGYRTWVNGPYGVKERLNVERFSWEAYDPMVLALQLSDMPAGFSQIQPLTRYTSNAWSAKQVKDSQKFLTLFEEWGRTNGYRTSFGQLNAAGLKGTMYVMNDIDVFRTNEGAHSAYVVAQTGALVQPKITRISVPAIGDEVIAYQTTADVGEGDKKVSATAFFIVFRRGHVLSTISTAALTDVATVDDAVNFARLVDKRTQAYPTKD